MDLVSTVNVLFLEEPWRIAWKIFRNFALT